MKKPKKKPSKYIDPAKQLQNFLIAKLRRISYQWMPRKEAIKKGRIARGLYKCSSCEGEFGPKEIQLDHTIPVIDPHEGFQDWNNYIGRLFCSADGFSIKCKTCHAAKTAYENEIRKQVKPKRTNNDI